MKTAFDQLKEFPSSAVNNSRQIIRKKLESMQKWPSESKAQELEELGFTCDFLTQDCGESPEEAPEELTNN